MSDENTFRPPTAAIPSRAAPAFLDQASPGTEPKRGKTGDILKPRKRAAKKAAPKPRKKKMPMTKKRVRAINRAAKAPEAPKNPNRPLEMKNQLHTVLAVVAALSKRESSVFANSMQVLEDMTRSERRRVIAALAQVYG